MAKWLTKAKGAFGGKRIRPVPFAVTSSAGRIVEGVRGAEHQVVSCPVTGERLFVLPLDVFPPPKSPPPLPSGRGSGKSRKSRGGGAADRTGTTPMPRAAPSPRPTLRDRIQPVREVTARVRDWFTPLRTLIAAVALCLVLTTWWGLRSRAIAAAEITLRTATSDAWAALEAGDKYAADEAFRAAVGALDTLGREEPSLRRAAAEVHVAVSLADDPLVDVLVDPARFERRRGEWIVIDAAVYATKDDAGRPIVLVDYPFEIDGQPLEVRADPELFEGLDVPNASVAEPFGVLFAAKLGSLTQPEGEFGHWTLTLEPGSGFLWVHGETIGTVGIAADAFRNEAELAALLDRQAAAEGIVR